MKPVAAILALLTVLALAVVPAVSSQRAGVWKRLHQVLLSKLRQAERIDFSRAVADSSSIRALGAGKKLDRTQPIAVVRARNITSSSTRKAFRSRPF